MDFHSDLVKITEFQPLEDYLVKKKASELFKTSQSNKITVSVNPSNLVELTRVGERFAPDSCVDGQEFKYVLGGKLIVNKQVPTHFEKIGEEASGFNLYDEGFAKIRPVIHDIIVRQRPGICYQPLRETSVYLSEDVQEKTEEPEIVLPGKTEKQRKIMSIPSVIKRKPESQASKSKEVKPEKIERTEKAKEITQFRKTEKRSEKSEKKTEPVKKRGKKNVKTILKKNKSEENNLSSNSEKKTVTWEEHDSQEDLKKDHEEKRKMHLEKFKYQCPSYLKEKETHEETLNRLEKIVEEEKEMLRDRGIETPESSRGSKYKKTYEELEKEIQNIRDMLNEDGNKDEVEQTDEDYEEAEISEYDEEESNQENPSIDYNYSSDDCKEDKAWLKPRFK